MLVLVTKNTDVVVDNCTFVDNAAGQSRDHYAVAESNSNVRFVGDEVHLNTACCKGVVMIAGDPVKSTPASVKFDSVRLQARRQEFQRCHTKMF